MTIYLTIIPSMDLIGSIRDVKMLWISVIVSPLP